MISNKNCGSLVNLNESGLKFSELLGHQIRNFPDCSTLIFRPTFGYWKRVWNTLRQDEAMGSYGSSPWLLR